MAQARYERAMLEERAARHHAAEGGDDVMSDGEASNTPLTPILGGGDHRGGGGGGVEPYMASGYEALAAREYEISAAKQPAKDVYSHFGTAPAVAYSRATDPVYAGAGGPAADGWATRSEQEQRRAMEDAYGGFAQRG
ncbi:hypothetical protein V493_07553, partial [Pseudogymnoascus sp. VKM F-4281 (FW-2241)]